MRPGLTRTRLTRFVAAVSIAACLCAGVAACGSTGQEATVTVIVPWSGLELQAFSTVALSFARSHHFQLNIVTTPAFAQQLDADKATGDLPDLVDLPSPGAVEQYEGDGLKPLTSIDLSSYDQPWRSLAESSSGTVYAVPVKADVKSLVWYKSGALRNTSWEALKDISGSGTPWCLGLNSGATSGWPGADWVADILLSTYGAGPYESWLTGTWTSPGMVGNAWQAWGALIRDGGAISGGVPAALATMYNGAFPAERCELEHGALSATGLTSVAGYSYEPFPSISGKPAPVLVSGDFMGLFTNNPYARSLLQYLASNQAQEMWVDQPGGHAFSADSAVRPDDYPPGVEQTIAKLLQPTTSSTRCFSAEDIMAPDLSAAFEQAILDYVTEPGSLGDLLKGLQTTANAAEKTQGAGGLRVAKNACDSP